jgi:hypothetical protein
MNLQITSQLKCRLKRSFDDRDSLTPLGMVVSVLLLDWEIQYGKWSSALVGPLLASTVSANTFVLGSIRVSATVRALFSDYPNVIAF